MKWSPFWVQIFNLPLNYRTKEIGWAIGSKLGEVMEVDVSDVGVQWGRSLRVRVRLDVTKNLVRGKKIIVEGGECKWVNLKYERLPNFCYRCDLLSHALKDCLENVKCNNQMEKVELQYGAWLRGDFLRKNFQEQTKYGWGRGEESGTRQWNTGVEPVGRTEPVRRQGALVGVVGAHAPRQTSIEHCPLTQQTEKDGELGKEVEMLHENGRVKGLIGKQEEKKSKIEENALEQGKAQTKEAESMQYDISIDHEVEINFINVRMPIPATTNECLSPSGLEVEQGPLALSYGENTGWIAETLGPNSKHWKRLAWEGNKSSNTDVKGQVNTKREGPTPLCEIDPNAMNQKRRKVGKLTSHKQDEEAQMVSGVAVAAKQHRQAS
ncbi:hypothetical protein SO802_006451 [Lithocarpus litseifolius]|uniref:Zinc knuckle CX2CX4HX4C domain-containing protein n=1 Tax=Lithocarpus litseifolius TaxID=425828 RepID=A0AAW2DL07_9ROSI